MIEYLNCAPSKMFSVNQTKAYLSNVKTEETVRIPNFKEVVG